MAEVLCQLPSKTPCKIAFVGEAPGKDEVDFGRVFCGNAGRIFDQLLRCAGIERFDCLVTNVFSEKLPDNEVKNWCISTKDKDKIPDYPLTCPQLDRGQWLHPDHIWHLKRLEDELRASQPTLVVPLGGTALWALTGMPINSIGRVKGTLMRSLRRFGDLKLMSMYHPTFLFYSYKYFMPMVMWLMKAKEEAESPDISYTERELWLDPSLNDISEFKVKYLDHSEIISIDIETIPKWRHLKCIGFADGPHHAICIPFTDTRSINQSFWRNAEFEFEAWKMVKEICNMPQPKVGQNFTYDLRWLHDRGVFVRNALYDTRLEHHALYPELPKDLGFLGALYAKERAWKGWGKGEKRDE